MNKTNPVVFILATLTLFLQSNIVLAEETASVVYCPEKIDCTKDKSVSSCEVVGQNSEWGNIQALATIRK